MSGAGSHALARGWAALALLAAGCLEATPPPVKGYVGGDGGITYPPAPDAVAPDLDGEAAEVAHSEGGAAIDGGAAAWAGTWMFTSGSQGLLCGNALSVIAVSGFLDITPSISGTLLTVVEDRCPFHFDLAGDVATEEPGQSCAAWAIPTIPTWTLTMQPDGTLHEMLGGRVLVNGEVCTISGGSTLIHQ